MKIESYLFFDGRCDEAIEFYKQTLGATVDALMRFSDSPDAHSIPPGAENLVMHANVRFGDTVVMMSDGEGKGNPQFAGFALAYHVSTDADAERVFNALSDGGQVQMPLTKTFFSSSFGMVADRFGVMWMVLVYVPR